MIAIEMGNTETWTNLAEKHDCSVEEAKDVMIMFAVDGGVLHLLCAIWSRLHFQLIVYTWHLSPTTPLAGDLERLRRLLTVPCQSL